MLALWEAARTYDSRKVREIPHVLRTLSWRLIDLYRNRNHTNTKATRRPPVLHLDDTYTETAADPSDPINDCVNSLAVAQILSALPPRHRYILTARFLEERTLISIGEEFGVTESRASQKVSEALTAARNLKGMF